MKNAKAFNNVNTLNNNDVSHHCKAVINHSEPLISSTHSTLHKIHIAQKNNNDQINIYNKDFNSFFTLAASDQ